MTSSTDRELQAWIDDWQTVASSSPAADQIRDYVKRRGRLLKLTFIVDTLIGLTFLVFLVHRALTQSDPIEQLAMGLLAVITVGATTFGLINWAGAIASRGADTATFMALAVSRARRLERSVRAAWLILCLQCAVFTPWIWYRLYGAGQSPSIRAQVFSWGLLTLMLSLALVFVLAIRRWSVREAKIVQDLQRELSLTDTRP